ncbi:MAG: pimeloyl-ACP methyl ester carboxylesterase [Minisyncoccia bacterium]|mgnify:FL=1|jgi:pimeloyl-ACP methyl ester carboxylesterase
MSTDLWAETSGDPALPLAVLVHGTMDRSAGMLRLSRRLDERFHVLRYDRRGYGRSRDVGGKNTVEQHVTDLAGVLQMHTPGRVVDLAFGHSFGGNVVLATAERHPELIRQAAIYETPLSWLDWWPGGTAGGAAAGATDPGEAAETFMRRLIGDQRWEQLPSGTRADRRAEGAAMVEEINDLRHSAPWAVEAVSIPLLAMGGELGRPHHQRGMQWLSEQIPSADYVRLDGAGHGAPNTHPAELAMLVTNFCASWLCDTDEEVPVKRSKRPPK